MPTADETSKTPFIYYYGKQNHLGHLEGPTKANGTRNYRTRTWIENVVNYIQDNTGKTKSAIQIMVGETSIEDLKKMLPPLYLSEDKDYKNVKEIMWTNDILDHLKTAIRRKKDYKNETITIPERKTTGGGAIWPKWKTTGVDSESGKKMDNIVPKQVVTPPALDGGSIVDHISSVNVVKF